MKSAAISVRVPPELKASIEVSAQEEGRTLASYVERVLAVRQAVKWILRDAQPLNRKGQGPQVALAIADGWPAAVMTADHAQSLGKQLIEAARIAKGLPPAE